MHLSKKVILIVIVAIISYSCNNDDDTNNTNSAFSGTLDWVKTFGGTSDEVINSVIEANDGNLVYAGTTKSINGDITDKLQEDNDFWLFKTDKEGTLLWSKTFGGTNDDQGQKVVQTTDGGYVLVGFSMSSDGDVSANAGIQDKWVIKTDANGTLLWEKSFGFAGSDQAFSIIPTNDNGLFMVGFLDITASGGAGNDFNSAVQHGVGEFWVHKLDANGNLEWRRYFGGSNNDRANDVVQTTDGYIIAGSAESTDFDISDPNGSYDFWVIKVDFSGNLVWEKSFGGSEIDIAYAISKTNDGNFVIAGDTRSTDGDVTNQKGNADLWVIKIDPLGNLIWQKTFGGSGFDTARGIKSMSDGDILVSGSSRSNDGDLSENLGQNDFWVLELSTNGTLNWQNTFGGSAIDFSYDLIQTTDNKVVAVGNTDSSDNQVNGNHGSFDAWVVKLK